MRREVGHEVEIEAVADDEVGLGQGLGDGRCAGGRVAGAEAQDGKGAPRMAGLLRVDGGGGEGQSEGAAPALALWDDEAAFGAGGGEGGGFGDAGDADLGLDQLGWGGEAGGLRRQRVPAEEADRNVESLAEGVDGGLGSLEGDRGDAGDGLGCQAGLGEGGAGEIVELLGRGVPLGADADGEGSGVEGEAVGCRMRRSWVISMVSGASSAQGRRLSRSQPARFRGSSRRQWRPRGGPP